jgi:hypothetical protein
MSQEKSVITHLEDCDGGNLETQESRFITQSALIATEDEHNPIEVLLISEKKPIPIESSRVELAILIRVYMIFVLDSPNVDFYAELLELYPDSFVILTIRDTDDQWWKS